MKLKIIPAILAATMTFSSLPMSFIASNIECDSDTKAISSYEAYVSAEKEFVRYDTLDLGVVFVVDDVSGYLYKVDLETEERTLILSQSVVENIEYNDRIYCILENNSIVSMKYDGSDYMVLYTATSDISNLKTDGEAVFFIEGNSIKRYHMDSNIMDVLLSDSNIIYFFLKSNIEIVWSKYSDSWMDYYTSDEYNSEDFALYGYYLNYSYDEPMSYKYLYNSATHTNTEYDESIEGSSISTYATVPAVTIINNKRVPLVGYENGKYFSENNPDPCDCHGGDYQPCTLTSTNCDCLHGINCSQGDCMQCVGFAYTVYRTIWDQPDADFDDFVIESPKVSFSNTSAGLASLTSFFQGLDNGTMMIGAKRGGGQHAFFVCYAGSNYAILYSANNTTVNCDIEYEYVYYTDLIEKYSSFDYIFQAP